MKLWVASAAALAAALVGSGAARADDALQTLQGMHMSQLQNYLERLS